MYIISLMPVPAFIKYIALFILFSLATYNFTRTSLDILESSKRLKNLESEVAVLEDKNSKLKEELTYVKSLDFIEREARRRLNLVKPNEKVFISATGRNQYSSVLGDQSTKALLNKTDSNPRKWYILFFN